MFSVTRILPVFFTAHLFVSLLHMMVSKARPSRDLNAEIISSSLKDPPTSPHLFSYFPFSGAFSPEFAILNSPPHFLKFEFQVHLVPSSPTKSALVSSSFSHLYPGPVGHHFTQCTCFLIVRLFISSWNFRQVLFRMNFTNETLDVSVAPAVSSQVSRFYVTLVIFSVSTKHSIWTHLRVVTSPIHVFCRYLDWWFEVQALKLKVPARNRQVLTRKNV